MGQNTPTIEGDRRSRRRSLGAILVAGALLFFPAIRAPFFLDDFLHRSMLEGNFPGHRSPFDLYDFVDDSNRAGMLERGLLPWWTDPALRIRFFRPLGSALVWLDHRLFGEHPLPMHLHSLGWWVLAVLAAHALYRRVLQERPATFATAIFALAPCHALPLAWLANRETLLAVALGAAALTFHARAALPRSGASRPRDALASAVLFALALAFGGEYALAFGGYVLAIALVSRNVTPWRRVARVWTFAVPAASYLALRARLGYGTNASGFYTDPLRDLAGFLGNAPWRAVALLAESWLTYDVSMTFGTARIAVALFVLGFGAALVFPLRRTLAALEVERRQDVLWLLLGSLLALAPVLSAVPAMRLLGVSTLGIAPAVAVLLDRAWFLDKEAPRTRAVEWTWLVALGVGYAQLVHGPLTSWFAAKRHRADAIFFLDRIATLRALAVDPPTANIAVVRGLAGTFFAPFALTERGEPPKRWCVMAQSGHTLVLRKGPNEIELVAPRGLSVFPVGDGNLFRAPSAPIPVGTVVTTPCFRVSVLEVSPMGPRSVRIAMADEAARYVWVEEDADTWQRAELPEIGFGAPFDP